MKGQMRMARFQKGLLFLLRRLRWDDQTFLIISAVVVGVVVGAGAYLFDLALHYANTFFWAVLPSWLGYRPFFVPLTPFVGALFLIPFIWFFPGDATKDGVPATMEAVALESGFIRWTNSFLRMVMSAVTLGSGGSAGSEGPIIQIGSALASGVGQFLHVSGNRLRVITACGASAGLAAIFNAPIAGVLFSLEVVLGEFNVHSFSPIVIASVVATAFSRAYITHGVALKTLPYQLVSAWEIALYAVMGALAGMASVGFVRIMERIGSFFEHKVPLPKALKPALGGLCVGVLGAWYPQVFGYTYGPITAALAGQYVVTTLLALLALKMVATAFTLGSGGSGGILYPSLFLGTMLGTAFGTVFHGLLPHLTAPAGAYGVVGMGAMLGAVIQAPMTAIIMIFELTNTYTVILPMMTACIIATLVQKSLIGGSIYTLSLARKGIDIEAGREMGILTSLKVEDIMDTNAVKIPAGTPYRAILNRCLSGACDYLYVMDEQENLEGVISFSDLKEFVFEEGFKDLVVAEDLYNPNVVFVTPGESLASSLNKFSYMDIDQLPVIERIDGKLHIRGVITRSRLLNAYRQELMKRAMIRSGAGGSGPAPPLQDRSESRSA